MGTKSHVSIMRPMTNGGLQALPATNWTLKDPARMSGIPLGRSRQPITVRPCELTSYLKPQLRNFAPIVLSSLHLHQSPWRMKGQSRSSWLSSPWKFKNILREIEKFINTLEMGTFQFLWKSPRVWSKANIWKTHCLPYPDPLSWWCPHVSSVRGLFWIQST